jgi:hypothetical protein
MPLIPLDQVSLTCARCHEHGNAAAANSDHFRFSQITTVVRFPVAGLTEKQVASIPALNLICEFCHNED